MRTTARECERLGYYLNYMRSAYGTNLDVVGIPIRSLLADTNELARLQPVIHKIKTVLEVQPDLVRTDTGERGDAELNELLALLNDGDE